MILPLLLGLTVGNSADLIPIYLGTYTTPEGSKGVYRTTLNPATGELGAPSLVAELPNPSYLALHPNGKTLYAVHEFTAGEASAFAVAADGSLKKLNTTKWSGGGPCYIEVDPLGKHALVAAYGQGTVGVLAIKPDGSLGEATSVFQNTGSGPNKGRQEGPHAHFVTVDPTSKFVYSCDLGTDEVLVFRYDATTGKLTSATPRAGVMPPGGGPRHLALSKDGKFAYVNNEMTLAVTTFARSTKDGSLKAIQTLSTLPEGAAVKGSTAALNLHPTGKWLYVSNRGHDSIAVYGVQKDGTLKLVEIVSAQVKTPRGMAIDPSGKWLVVGGQDSNEVTSLQIDAKTGKLTPTKHRIMVSTPVCVLFAY